MTSTTIDRPRLNPALKSFWKTKADIKLLKGGRASTKTWDAAGFAVILASNYTVKFLCMRQFQNKIQESVYAIIKIQIERLGFESEFEILKTVIRHLKTGSEFHFYGIHRNISEIKGFEGADIGWIEEAEGLTKEQWSIIEPTLRKEGAETWMLFNPHAVNDFISTFRHDPENGVIIRHINYDENPFLSNTMLRKINRLKESDYEEYEHHYLGIPYTDDDRVIIKRAWIEVCIDAHKKLDIEVTGAHIVGFDVADSGKDLCSQIHFHGCLAYWGEHWKGKEDELLASTTRVFSKSLPNNSTIIYDAIGVGASCGAKLNELKKDNGNTGINHRKFIAGGKVENPDKYYMFYGTEAESIKNKDFFVNVKAQKWWAVANRFMMTYNAITKGHHIDEGDIISISSNMPNLQNLVTELSTPRKDYDKSGKVKVESKDDLKKRDVPSPNDADAFIMGAEPSRAAYNINAW